MCVFFFQADDGIRDLVRYRGLGDVYEGEVVWGVSCVGVWVCGVSCGVCRVSVCRCVVCRVACVVCRCVGVSVCVVRGSCDGVAVCSGYDFETRLTMLSGASSPLCVYYTLYVIIACPPSISITTLFLVITALIYALSPLTL